METRAVGLIREAYDAVNAGRIAEWSAANLPPSFELVPRARIAGAGFIAPENVARFFEDLSQAWESIQIEIEEIVDLGERVVALGRVRNRGRSSGMELDVVAAHLWTVEGDAPVRVEFIGDREEALRRGRAESTAA